MDAMPQRVAEAGASDGAGPLPPGGACIEVYVFCSSNCKNECYKKRMIQFNYFVCNSNCKNESLDSLKKHLGNSV